LLLAVSQSLTAGATHVLVIKRLQSRKSYSVLSTAGRPIVHYNASEIIARQVSLYSFEKKLKENKCLSRQKKKPNYR